MVGKKEIIGDQVIIGGRALSLSKAIRAGDFVFLTGQIPMKNGQPMTTGTIEEQTKVALEEIKQTLKLASCGLEDIVKSMVWLRERSDFAGFNSVYGEYFPEGPPTRSAVISELLVDVRVEIEVVAFKSLK
ncbi:MAG: RidA family protein [Proteobacteria bacterium]|jgi:2-iminobutanoate/2-iminopropanoate deaminase|nr:RidA family protein [Pseudomonadota bacterium]